MGVCIPIYYNHEVPKGTTSVPSRYVYMSEENIQYLCRYRVHYIHTYCIMHLVIDQKPLP